MRHTAFTFTLDPSASEEGMLMRHAGAARFAFNQALGHFKQCLDQRREDSTVKVPWSGFDLINYFNRWKLSAAAGMTDGKPGLPWRGEVRQQVFEEAMVDLGKAIQNWRRARSAKVRARRVGFPRFRRKGQNDGFRLRNQKNSIRVSGQTVWLPKLQAIGVRENTRCLRRMLTPRQGIPAARILFATVRQKAGRWVVRLNIEAADVHPATCADKKYHAPIGIDRGLHVFAVAATADGEQRWREYAPKPLGRHIKHLRRLSRQLSRKLPRGKDRTCPHSKNSLRAKKRLGRLHHRIANIRRAYVHTLSSQVAKTHSHLVLEDLHIAGMVRNRCLARSIHDSAWGLFAQQLRYKGAWYGCKVSTVDRFAPSSKTCCRCDWVASAMPLGVRVFTCAQCGWSADRDTNAAANCARWASVNLHVTGT